MTVGTSQATTTDGIVTGTEQRIRLIRQQLNRARRKVRWIELTAAALRLAGCWLAGLLLLVLADHWLGALPVWVRWLALGGFVLLTGWVVVFQMGPLLLHAIHPLYAAKQLEEARPWLKNSLLNFLFLRRRAAEIPPAVLDALERAAAENLTKVPVDESLDRTAMLRGLTFVAALFTVAAFYQLIAPKSPWQSAARILMPWRDTPPPSRVEIVELEPKDADVPYGEKVTVRVYARGVRPNDQAIVLISSADGAMADRTVDLVKDEQHLNFTTTLPPGDEGLRQDLTYRVVIGDFTSPPYRLRVLQKPVISVYRVDYQFPAYMRRPPYSREGQGDIEAPEGTEVTVWARANMPIREAYLEWDPDERGQPTQGYHRMEVDGQTAKLSFMLQLAEDRRRAWHESYQVRYLATDNRSSRDVESHRIHVVPDMAPVVDVLAPKKRRVEVPYNGELTIEVRAVDPDFGLTYVGIVASRAGGQRWSPALLEDLAGWQGQFVGKLVARPAQLQWNVGETITFRAVARDNRHDRNGQLACNESSSVEYQVVVVPPIEPPRPPSQPGQPKESTSPAPSQPSPADGPTSRAQEKAPAEKPAADQAQRTDVRSDTQKDTAADRPEKKPMSEQPQAGPATQPSQGQEAKSDNGAGQQAAKSAQSSSVPSDSEQQTPAADAQKQEGPSADAQKQSPSAGVKGPPTGKPAGIGQREESQPATSEGTEAASSPGQETGTLQQGKTEGGRSAPPGAATRPDKPLGHDDKQAALDASKSDRPDGEGAASQPRPSSATEGSQPESGAGQPDQPSHPRYDGTPDAPVEDLHDGDVFEIVRRYLEQQNKWPKLDTAPPRPADSTGAAPAGPDGSLPGEQTERKPSTQQPGQGDTSQSQPAAEPATPPPATDLQQPSQQAGSKVGRQDGRSDQVGSDKTGSASARPGAALPTEGQTQADSPPASENMSPSGPKEQPTGSRRPSAGSQEPGKQQPLGGKGASGEQDQGRASEHAASPQKNEQPSDMQAKRLDGQPSGTQGPAKEQGPSATGASQDTRGGSDTSQGSSAKDSSSSASAKPSKAPTQQGPQQGPTGGGGNISDRLPAAGRPTSGQPTVIQTPEVEPNLEYARQATDLVLEYLRDQQQNPDAKLLERLGWTPDQLAEFLRRWDQLKKSAQQDEQKRGELDEALRSLGLRPPADRLRQGEPRGVARTQQTESAERSAPPPKYLELFNAFRKGAARAAEEPSP